MKKNWTTLATLLLTTGLSINAQAGPEYTEEELFEMAELVVDVEVAETTCDGSIQTDENGNVTTSYQSELDVLSSSKGGAEGTIFYKTASTVWQPGYAPIGCSAPSVVLAAGWVGRLYLSEHADGAYRLLSWNAAVKDHEASIIEELPQCSAPADPSNPDQGGDVGSEPGGDAGSTGAVAEEASGCSIGSAGSGAAGNGWLSLAFMGLGLFVARRR